MSEKDTWMVSVETTDRINIEKVKQLMLGRTLYKITKGRMKIIHTKGMLYDVKYEHLGSTKFLVERIDTINVDRLSRYGAVHIKKVKPYDFTECLTAKDYWWKITRIKLAIFNEKEKD